MSMSEGRLKKIKNLWTNNYELEGYDITEYIELPEGYIDWLIEQAEEVQRLNKRYIGEYARLEAENKRMKEALKVIAKETQCDDTWDFANRILDGKGPSGLSYRMGSEMD